MPTVRQPEPQLDRKPFPAQPLRGPARLAALAPYAWFSLKSTMCERSLSFCYGRNMIYQIGSLSGFVFCSLVLNGLTWLLFERFRHAFRVIKRSGFVGDSGVDLSSWR